MNTLSTRYGRSSAPTWAAPFFGVHNSGAPIGLHNTLHKYIKPNGLGRFGGTHFEGPIWPLLFCFVHSTFDTAFETMALATPHPSPGRGRTADVQCIERLRH